MKARLFSLSLVVCVTLICGNLFAQQRSLESAMQIANEFSAMQNVNNGAMRIAPQMHAAEELKLAYVSKDEATETPYFYVINKGESGYVIVSGDERAYEVLGYSDAGNFDLNSMPANMLEYLNQYEAEIKSLERPTAPSASANSTNGLPEPKLSASKASSSLKKSVAPLLGNTQWNQRAPYNLKCPMYDTLQTLTGCVATAMAQIMYYHKWPEQGQGSNTYMLWDSISLGVNFANSTYDWDNMTPQYSEESSQAEKNAVTQLMYDCGVAVNMKYGTSASGAYSSDVPLALSTYFNYDTDIRRVFKSIYTNAEWTNIIKNELSSNRPIYYDGVSLIGAHAFVCDGYTEDDFFHFNWGWGGSQNGYFRLYSLNPAIGDGSFDGFNKYRSIIIGIQKPDTIVYEKHYALNLLGSLKSPDSTLVKGDTISVSAYHLENQGSEFSGIVIYALLDMGGTVISAKGARLKDFKSSYYIEKLSLPVPIPETIADGDYRICVCYKADDMENWRISESYSFKPNYLKVNVSGGIVTITEDDPLVSQLEAVEFDADTLYCNRNGFISVKIENNGIEYASSILVSLEYGDEVQLFNFQETTILESDSFEMNIIDQIKDFNVPADSSVVAKLKLFYDKSNSGSFAYDLLDSCSVVLNSAPSEESDLQLTEQMKFEDNNNVPRNNAKLSFTIKNNGGYATNRVYPVISSTDSLFLGNLPGVNTFIGKNQTETYELTVSFTLPAGEYLLQLKSKNSEGEFEYFDYEKSNIAFRLVDVATSVTNSEPSSMLIYPNPAQDQIRISGVELEQVTITDLSGRTQMTSNEAVLQISHLTPGSYLVYVLDKEGKLRVEKLIKQ